MDKDNGYETDTEAYEINIKKFIKIFTKLNT